MKIVNYLILIFFLNISCKEGISERYTYNIPKNFIEPKNNVDIQVSNTTSEILEYLTHLKFHNQYDYCSIDNNFESNYGSGIYDEFFEVFINLDHKKKEVSFLRYIEDNCKNKTSGNITLSLETIPLEMISTIDTSTIKYDLNRDLLTALIINTKFNSESVYEKSVRTFNKDNRIYFELDSGFTKKPIIIYSRKPAALNLKYNIEKLKTEFNLQ